MSEAAWRAAGLACPACHDNTEWIAVGRPLERANSKISKFACRRCGCLVVSKAPRTMDRAGWRYRLVQREFQTLTSLATTFGRDARYGVVEPLGWFDGVMVTRWFDGKDMTHHVRSLGTRGALEACRHAGRWLRRLHDANPAGYVSQPFDAADKLDTLVERYAHWFHDDPMTAQAWQTLRRGVDSIAGAAIRSTWNHGDFKPENLLCDGRRYVGLDIHLQFTAPIVIDIASFVDHVWLARRQLVPRRGGHDFRAIETAFLRGYGDLGEGGLAALHWSELYFALSYLGRDRRQGKLQAAYGKWRTRPLIRMAAEQLNDIV